MNNEPTLLKHLDELRSGQHSSGTSSQVLFTIRLNDESEVPKVIDHYRTIVVDEVNTEESGITGLLMGQSSYILHFLEGPCHAVRRLLAKISTYHNTNQAPGNRLLASIESNSDAYFPEWYSCIVPEKKASQESGGDNAKDTVAEIVQRLKDMGSQLSTQGNSGVDISAYADSLPEKAILASLCGNNTLLTLKEFIAFSGENSSLLHESETISPFENAIPLL